MHGPSRRDERQAGGSPCVVILTMRPARVAAAGCGAAGCLLACCDPCHGATGKGAVLLAPLRPFPPAAAQLRRPHPHCRTDQESLKAAHLGTGNAESRRPPHSVRGGTRRPDATPGAPSSGAAWLCVAAVPACGMIHASPRHLVEPLLSAQSPKFVAYVGEPSGGPVRRSSAISHALSRST